MKKPIHTLCLLLLAACGESSQLPVAASQSATAGAGGQSSTLSASTGEGGANTSSTAAGTGGAGASGGSHAGGQGGEAGEGGWRSALYPKDWTPAYQTSEGHRLHDYSYAGYRNGEKVPPASNNAPIYDVTSYGADATGGSDSTAAVQSAIAAAAQGGIVFFPAGSYRFDGTLNIKNSHVVLRGAGADKSKLFFTSYSNMAYKAHIAFAKGLALSGNYPLVQDAPSHQNELLVADAGALAVGDDIAVGWMISSDFVAEHHMTGTWDHSSNAFYHKWQTFFWREIVAIDRSKVPHRVVVDVPLRYPSKTRDLASIKSVGNYLSECGVEDLALGNAVGYDNAWAQNQVQALRFDGCKDCWLSGVKSFDPPTAPTQGYGADDHLQSGGVLVERSKRMTLADSEMHRAQHKGGGGNGYLFQVRTSSEVLFRDLKSSHGRHNFIQNWGFGLTGCVWLRVHSSEGRAWFNKYVPGGLGYSEFHHSLALANLIDSSTFDDGWSIVNRGSYSSYSGHTGTQNVMWNTRGSGIVRSMQFGYGFIVGTAPGLTIQTDPNIPFAGGAKTEPVDWVEGPDAADSLKPSSLYEDQRAKRLAN
jgi:hypothetical protein